jgi:hypothetical protein
MRILLVAFVVVAVMSSGADAAPSKPYVGLFQDQTHSVTSVSPPAFVPFDLWICWLPSAHGLQATEFQVTFPSNVIRMATVQNPDLAILIGCPPPGESYVCAVFTTCQTDWTWTHHLTCMLTVAAPSFIEIGPPSYTTILQAANCESGYPMEPVTVLNKFGINQDGVIGVESETWGAIKSLYR